MTNLSKREKVLVAAGELEKEFNSSQLVVKCWQMFPRSFGLENYEDKYPDANSVLSLIMGSRGLTNTGYLQKVKSKTYRVSDLGRKQLKEFNATKEIIIPNKEHPMKLLNEKQRELVTRLIGTSAWGKYCTGKKKDITYAEAYKFWDVNEITTDIESHINKTRIELQVIEGLLEKTQTTHNTDEPFKNVRNLHHLLSFLENMFSNHIAIMKKRYKVS